MFCGTCNVGVVVGMVERYVWEEIILSVLCYVLH
jgi:hypothetical protein